MTLKAHIILCRDGTRGWHGPEGLLAEALTNSVRTYVDAVATVGDSGSRGPGHDLCFETIISSLERRMGSTLDSS